MQVISLDLEVSEHLLAPDADTQFQPSKFLERINSTAPPGLRLLSAVPSSPDFRAAKEARRYIFDYLIPSGAFDVLLDDDHLGLHEHGPDDSGQDSVSGRTSSSRQRSEGTYGCAKLADCQYRSPRSRGEGLMSLDGPSEVEVGERRIRTLLKRRRKVVPQDTVDGQEDSQNDVDERHSGKELSVEKVLLTDHSVGQHEGVMHSQERQSSVRRRVRRIRLDINRIRQTLELFEGTWDHRAIIGDSLSPEVSVKMLTKLANGTSEKSVSRPSQHKRNSGSFESGEKRAYFKTVDWTSCITIQTPTTGTSTTHEPTLLRVWDDDSEKTDDFIKISICSNIYSDFHIRKILGLTLAACTELISPSAIPVGIYQNSTNE